MYFALYMYSMPVDLRFRRLRAQKVAVLVPTLRSISRETDLVHVWFESSCHHSISDYMCSSHTPFPNYVCISAVLQAFAPPFHDPLLAVLLESDRTSKLPGQTAFLNTIVLSELDGNILDIAVPPSNLVLYTTQPRRLADQVHDLRQKLFPHRRRVGVDVGVTGVNLNRHALIDKMNVLSQEPRGLTNRCERHGQTVINNDDSILSDGLGFKRGVPDVPEDF